MASQIFLLIHSPLVGPYTWFALADELRKRGHKALVPHLSNHDPFETYWQQHVKQVVETIDDIEAEVILVGHSGGGGLLPAIAEALAQPVVAYAFLDALIPKDGRKRLDLFDTLEEAEQFRAAAVGGLLPTWTEEDLADSIQDTEHRRNFVAELQPMPLAVYEEALPVHSGWPAAPCYYLQFSPIYETFAKLAVSNGWHVEQMRGTHFHLLNEAAEVAYVLVSWMEQLGLTR